MLNPQSFKTSRTPRLALPAAATLLLLVLALLMSFGPVARPAEACPQRTCVDLPPVVTPDNPSVVVEEGQTATNTGTYEDPFEELTAPPSAVTLSASVGTITKSGTTSGTWSWSYKTPSVAADEPKTVTIIAKDAGEGADSSTSFSLTVKDGPPTNDSFSSALDLATVGPSSTTTDGTNLATMEPGEPRPSSPTKDCGITGVSNSVWFKFKYGGQGGLPPLPNPNAYYNFDTKGTNFDTVLALYEGSSVDTLNQIECSNDNSLPNWNDNLRIPQSKLSVGKTYYVQLTGTGGARSGKYQLHYEPRGLTQPKVMAYNIVKGEYGGGLPAVRDTIKALQPDIVLLNEVRDYPLGIEGPYGVSNQWEWLADQTGFPYRKYEGCTLMGGNGTNGVAILSRYPITGSTSWDLPDSDPLFDHWCILKADISIDGLNHHVFSTRFNWEGDSENRAQQEAAIDIVRSMPPTDPVIIGGDFNAPWSERPYTKELWDGSGLTDAYGAAGSLFAEADPYNRKDYIYYRGPYSVYQHQERWSEQLGVPPASDHTFVFTHFLRRSITQPPDTTITSGPSGSVSATTASFAFSSSEPGSTFECSLDGAPFSACTSPKEYSSLAKGEHTFQVRAIGTGGTNPTPASRTWTVVDTASPKVSSVTPANNATGVKRNTNLTATFSEKMDALSLTKSTFQLFKVNTDGSTTQITNVTVTPSTDGLKATLNPFGTSTTLLAKSTKYKAVLTTGAKDVTGNPLDQNPTTSGNQQMVWSFKTGLQ